MRSKTNDNTTCGAGKAPVKVRRAVVGGPSAGVITLEADDFAQFEECMSQEAKPTQAMSEAAQLHRRLMTR